MGEEHGLHDEIAMFRERTNIIETKGETELPTATTYCIEGQRICTAGLDSPTGAERALLEENETLKNQKQALCTKLEESRVKIAAGRDEILSLQKTFDEKDRLQNEELVNWEYKTSEIEQERESMSQMSETIQNRNQALEERNAELNTQLADSTQ